jgi:hypothetical protein
MAATALRIAKESDQYLRNQNKRSVGLAQLTKLHTELTEHADAITFLHKSLSKLRSRAGMRELRARENGEDTAADSLRDPEGWKREMRLKLFKELRKNGKR